MRSEQGFPLDGRFLAWGLVLGAAAGAGLALWFAPRSGVAFRSWAKAQIQSAAASAKTRIETAAPSDPVAKSLAEGKEAARLRREGVVP